LPTFGFFLCFFQAYVLPLQVSVRLRLGLGFIFYVKFVSTKPTVLLPCVTVTPQVAH